CAFDGLRLREVNRAKASATTTATITAANPTTTTRRVLPCAGLGWSRGSTTCGSSTCGSAGATRGDNGIAAYRLFSKPSVVETASRTFQTGDAERKDQFLDDPGAGLFSSAPPWPLVSSTDVAGAGMA